jgi:hypothetical protein
VDVFEFPAEGETPFEELLPDLLQPLEERGQFMFCQEAGLRQRPRPRLAPSQIVAPEATVKAEGGGEAFSGGMGGF